MAKAIVWFCWGEKFIHEAAGSARSTAGIEADRILITDAAGAASAKRLGDFTSVIQTDLVFTNNLEKSRLIDFLPDGYDTYLFLDTDTRVVGDVSLGFAKAEQHGIAVAPAPNYNLAEFFNFSRIMEQLGEEPADQIMYNTGVIFFKLTPAARRVFERWRDLCATAGVTNQFPRDQPFFNLALEQLGVLPYVLSPLYNYRSLGEFAVGNIRLWHSHFPVPSDLNTFKTAWPARRLVDGMLLRSDEDAARTRHRPPQGMLQLSLAQLNGRLTAAQARKIAAQAVAMAHDHGSSSANSYVLSEIGTQGSADMDEAYFTEAMHYHLGLLHAHAADPEEMARHLRLSNTMPTAEDDQLYSDHVNMSHVIRARQLAAIKRGLPPILIACMPRSASATLTYSVADALDIPVVHVSAGKFPEQYLAWFWLNTFLEGGAITQDHFGASAFNLRVLEERGVREVFILVRDPRPAARSWVHFLAQGRYGSEPLEQQIVNECVGNFVPWLQGWIDCAKNKALPFRIHWLTYREVCQDLPAILRKISSILGVDHPAFAAFAEHQKLKEVRVHFVSGNDQAWQSEVSAPTRDLLWQACTNDIRGMLDLKS
jgi:hypothetical protein